MYFFLAAALIAFDQVTKLWAAQTFPFSGPGLRLGLGFHLTYVHNTGAAFGILQNSTLLLGILSAIVSLALVVYMVRHAKELPKLQMFALTLIFSGAVGNMIDRFRLGYVIDFIHFHLPNFDFPVFNVADICVVTGAGLLLLSSFLEDRREAQRVKQQQNETAAEPETPVVTINEAEALEPPYSATSSVPSATVSSTKSVPGGASQGE